MSTILSARALTRPIVLLLAALALALGVLSTAPGMTGQAEARAPEGWYRCWVSGHGWMYCYDV